MRRHKTGSGRDSASDTASADEDVDRMTLDLDQTEFTRNELVIYQIGVVEPSSRRKHFSLLYEHTASGLIGGCTNHRAKVGGSIDGFFVRKARVNRRGSK